jgi:hypothetical protein
MNEENCTSSRRAENPTGTQRWLAQTLQRWTQAQSNIITKSVRWRALILSISITSAARFTPHVAAGSFAYATPYLVSAVYHFALPIHYLDLSR